MADDGGRHATLTERQKYGGSPTMGAQLRVYRRRIKSVAVDQEDHARRWSSSPRPASSRRSSGCAASAPYADEITRRDLGGGARQSTIEHPLTDGARRTPPRPRSCSSPATAAWPARYCANVLKEARGAQRERCASEGKEVRAATSSAARAWPTTRFRDRDIAGAVDAASPSSPTTTRRQGGSRTP